MGAFEENESVEKKKVHKNEWSFVFRVSSIPWLAIVYNSVAIALKYSSQSSRYFSKDKE